MVLSGVGAGALVALSAGALADNSNVAYAWKKDAKLYYRWTEGTGVNMKADAGMESVTQNGRVSTVTWDIKDVDAAGLATVKMTYNGFSMSVQLPRTTEPLKWDSLVPATTDASNPMAMIFGHLIGESITFKVDARGMVHSVEGMEDLAKKLRQVAVDTPGAGTFVNGIEVTFTANQMKANLERVLSGNPEKKVAPGDSWTDEFTLPNAQLGSFNLARTHTLDSMSSEAATISTSVVVTLNEPKADDPKRAMFSMMSPELKKGTGTGLRTINLTDGCPQQSTLTLLTEIAMSGGGMKLTNASTWEFKLERLTQLPPQAVIPGETPIPVPPSPPKTTPPVEGDSNLTPHPKK
ncbi:MAG: DUF6263 family protein [Phycisphaerales bacterium]